MLHQARSAIHPGMEEKKIHCVNHPGRNARRRCYQCLSSICPACQRRASGHIFCSFRCQALYWLSEKSVLIKRRYLRVSLRLRRVNRVLEKVTGSGIFRLVYLGVLLLILVQTAALLHTTREIGDLMRSPPVYSSPVLPSPPGEAPAGSLAAAPLPPTPAKKTAKILLPTNDLTRGDPLSRKVAITFDGGGQGNAAVRILDALKARGLKATFFLTGEFIKRYPAIVRRIASEGHEVGNHTYNHPHLTTYASNYRQDTLPGVTRKFLIAELEKNEVIYEKITGRKMEHLWRAPYGEQNAAIRRWAWEAGYRHVSWTYDSKTHQSLDGLDWVTDKSSALYLSSKQIVHKILSFDQGTNSGLGGGILLFHLGSERKTDPFYPRIGELLDQLKDRGYKVGSIGSMIGAVGGG
ncbi:MAG TPA: hypothetical protein ENH32_04670 [Proteobacteria bacterium]|nr:hypothetical protein [Pseudomonadota bacterium]